MVYNIYVKYYYSFHITLTNGPDIKFRIPSSGLHDNWSRQLVSKRSTDNIGPDNWSRQLVSTTGLQPGILKKRKKYNSMRKND